MAYEIPQQLQHKERIMFGLTFSQISWAAFFSFTLLIIFKLNLPLIIRFTLAIIPAMLGILFVFFDFYKWIIYLKSFIKFRSASLNSLNMKNLIEIKKVENNIIKSHNDVAVLHIAPLNFSGSRQSRHQPHFLFPI